MSALTSKGNSFYKIIIKDLGLMPSNVPEWIKEVPEHFKTQGICNKAVRIEPRSLAFVPDCLIGMCPRLVCNTTTTKDMAWLT